MENKKRYSLTLSPEIVKKAKIFAEENEISFPALVENALLELITEDNAEPDHISSLKSLPNQWQYSKERN